MRNAGSMKFPAPELPGTLSRLCVHAPCYVMCSCTMLCYEFMHPVSEKIVDSFSDAQLERCATTSTH